MLHQTFSTLAPLPPACHWTCSAGGPSKLKLIYCSPQVYQSKSVHGVDMTSARIRIRTVTTDGSILILLVQVLQAQHLHQVEDRRNEKNIERKCNRCLVGRGGKVCIFFQDKSTLHTIPLLTPPSYSTHHNLAFRFDSTAPTVGCWMTRHYESPPGHIPRMSTLRDTSKFSVHSLEHAS